MSTEDFGFAPPPFDADAALQTLRRSLRDLKLAERGKGFELRGKPALEAVVENGAIAVKLTKRLQLTPEWERLTLKNSADVRKLVDEVKRRLERWLRED